MEKKVDTEWKKNVQEEKEKMAEEKGKTHPVADANFLHFISNLSFQSMMFLGQIEDPVTKKVEKNLGQAKYVIDILGILEEKTKGNLTSQEETALGQFLHQLRMAYVSASEEDSIEDSGSTIIT